MAGPDTLQPERATPAAPDPAGTLVGTFTVGNSPYGQVLLDDRTLLVANFYDGSLSASIQKPT